jgi:hypothetical protein
MQGLSISISKRLNALLGRSGPVLRTGTTRTS